MITPKQNGLCYNNKNEKRKILMAKKTIADLRREQEEIAKAIKEQEQAVYSSIGKKYTSLYHLTHEKSELEEIEKYVDKLIKEEKQNQKQAKQIEKQNQ